MGEPKPIPFDNATRGLFAFRRYVPRDGHHWVETLATNEEGGVGLGTRPGPWLVEGGEVGHARVPLERTDVHRRFARLSTPAAIVRFANRHGLLGCDQALIWTPDTADPTGRDWEHHGGRAEHLATWRRETRRLAALVKLWDLLNDGQVGELGRYILWGQAPIRVWARCAYTLDGPFRLMPIGGRYTPLSGDVYRRDGQEVALLEHLIAAAGVQNDQLLKLWRFGEVRGPAHAVLAALVNERLRGHVNPTVLTPGGTLRLQPDSLLTAIYVSFALEIAGQAQPERMCRQCERPFAGRKGQIYCSGNCRSLAAYHRLRRANAQTL